MGRPHSVSITDLAPPPTEQVDIVARNIGKGLLAEQRRDNPLAAPVQVPMWVLFNVMWVLRTGFATISEDVRNQVLAEAAASAKSDEFTNAEAFAYRYGSYGVVLLALDEAISMRGREQ